jgi:hypothetical protein
VNWEGGERTVRWFNKKITNNFKEVHYKKEIRMWNIYKIKKQVKIIGLNIFVEHLLTLLVVNVIGTF